MKILLIMPDANIHRLNIGQWGISFREAPLTLTMLAALVPKELNASIRIIDESIEPLPEKNGYDIVGISCLTGTALRAYQIAESFREKGVMVVLGGPHVTLCPQEAKEHADSIVIGFAETSWPQLLKDFSVNQLKPEYRSQKICMDGLPDPKRNLQRKFAYMTPFTVMATRGCKGRCDFCSVPAAGYAWQERPVGEVIDEIRRLPRKRFVFNDVNLLENRTYAKELFSAMKPLKKVWGGLCTSQIVKDEEMLDLMRDSGCIYLLIGFESVSQTALDDINKGFNRAEDYHALIKMLHFRDIIVQGCFIFGFDSDTTTIFEETVDLVNELQVDIPRYAVYTPYPGTPAFKKLKSEKRLLHEQWHHYDTQHVVFQPSQMTPKELDDGFKQAWNRTFSLKSITHRTLRRSKNCVISFVGNCAYRMYINRLNREKNRLFFAE